MERWTNEGRGETNGQECKCSFKNPPTIHEGKLRHCIEALQKTAPKSSHFRHPSSHTHQSSLALIDGHLTMTVNTTYSSCIYLSDASCNIYSPRFYKHAWHAWALQCTSVTAIKKLKIMLLLHSCIQCNTYHNEPERDGPYVIVQKGPRWALTHYWRYWMYSRKCVDSQTPHPYV